MSNAEIIEAVNLLAERYPLDKCDVWVKREPGSSRVSFTAYIGARDSFLSACASGVDLKSVVEECCKDAGPRGGSDLLLAQAEEIFKARIALSKAESAIEPVILSILIKQLENKK